FKNKKIVAHCHEWISGAALLHLKKYAPKLGLVFTTHATSLGRTLTGYNRDVMSEVSAGLKEGRTAENSDAYKYNVEGQHLIEKACAKNSVFTTVSEVTGKEATYILGKKPDLILPNGLDFKKFGSIDDILRKHKVNRDKVYMFLRSYFLPYYKCKVFHSPVIYLSGRYELKSKGIDIFISALGKLNDELKNAGYDKNVFAFIFVPASVRGPKSSVVNNFNIFKKLEHNVDEMLVVDKENIINGMVHGKSSSKLVKPEMLDDSINFFKGLEKEGDKPPLSAFNLNYGNDTIINMLKENGLDNSKDDVVKIVFYPTYVSESDGVLGLQYYDAITGIDLGVFPSRYEPWGYTPIEAGANMCAGIASDLSGFGKFIQEHVKDRDGIQVLKMEDRSYDDIVHDLVDKIKLLALLDRESLEEIKVSARTIVELDNWKDLIKHYFKAYELAVSRS
ncbi:MAG: hypothetical protein GON13_02340, partial [Nanoarchaeota archaeon]|nr:hypothetical protein [Nanoarchaeota archaeon]